jgi:hypothetical protein
MQLAGKDTRMWKIIVPLVMGFKTTGALIFAISAMKIFLLKALMVSKVALLAAGFLVIKKLMNSVGTHHHPYLFAYQPLPYYHDHGLESVYPSAYGYSNYVTAAGHYETATGHSSHDYGTSGSDGLTASAADDLQAHYSTNALTNVQATMTNHTAVRKNGNRYLKKF